MFNMYDVIVAGAGHAGAEAAAAAANMGARTLLITMNLTTIARMSCNPAMGGIAKGQIVREIDALGGYSGIATDISMIQFRMLNTSKGPAMWSPRAQSDRALFSQTWRRYLETILLLDMYEDTVVGVDVHGGRVRGVYTQRGHHISARALVLTNGTFLNGIIYVGDKKMVGGRMAESAVSGLSEQLVGLGFESGRLKTGTPPRLDGRSVDYTKMEIQKGDKYISGFSFMDTPKPKAEEQKCCWITHTTPEVHEILREGFATSPMFTGRIEGTGPRYCPSIEDKISRFADKTSHQLFVEPEGWHTSELYLNGFSTSLAEEVQIRALRKIKGLENCKLLKPGYAIEYDYFFPTQLRDSLETKRVKNLFFAGQINGTTGYEEAAGQGLIAGMNACLAAQDKAPFTLARDEAYIGVLIDDLITKGTKEPYRMFTSRAEFRTLLRQDNADLRLTEKSFTYGLASIARVQKVERKKAEVSALIHYLKMTNVKPEEVAQLLHKKNASPLLQAMSFARLLLRSEITLAELIDSVVELRSRTKNLSEDEIAQTEIQIKYEQYIAKEQELADKVRRSLDLIIPENFAYEKLRGLGAEAVEKLKKIAPRTLRQASEISGISPSDIHILLVYMGR